LSAKLPREPALTRMSIFKQILEPSPAGPGDPDLPSSGGVGDWLRVRRVRNVGGTVRTLSRIGEIAVLAAVSGLLNFWTLSRNGWANTYYAAAVRSMSTSWHDFLYASLDHSGVMTIDKPPLAFWIQSLSVRVFGYHSLSILIPDALIGVATVLLLYDLVRRVFGRLAGVLAGLALASTPITVAMSRHNNPDALLALCCVAALWFLVRALEDGGTRWIVLSGVMVGLGFETKMALAFAVVPGIVAAWLWVRPRGLRRSIDQLVAGGLAMLVVGGAWPLVVWLTPAIDRPWISGTSDNSIFQLIFGYNGLGRVAGQSGGPSTGAGASPGVFGGSTGPLRLLNSELGGQAGWLIGVALVGGLAIVAASRLRRSDPRTGWIVAVGGSFLATAVLFSFASGIFHPYYVSLLAPFIAALVGAVAGQLLAGRLGPPAIGAFVIAAGVACEIVVLGDYHDQLTWVAPLLLATGAVACVALLVVRYAPVRAVAISAAIAALLVAPAIWAVDTLGYATQSTFPAGGPAGDNSAALASDTTPFGAPGLVSLGNGAVLPAAAGGGAVQALFGGAYGGHRHDGRGSFVSGPFLAGALPAGVGMTKVSDIALRRTISYVRHHGGGTIAVASQSSAADAIIAQNANVAGLGGWSGRESDPSIAWLAQEVASGHIRWVYNEGAGNFGVAAEGRPGAVAVLHAAERACTEVDRRHHAPYRAQNGIVYEDALYNCTGRAGAIAALG